MPKLCITLCKSACGGKKGDVQEEKQRIIRLFDGGYMLIVAFVAT